MANRNISGERQAAYYLGNAISAVGMLVFFSAFVIVVIGISGQGNHQALGTAFGVCGVGGFALIAIGQGIASIGSQGLAGSGVVLDPEKAREDMEPWSRMAGGMVSDAADEAGVNLSQVWAGSAADSEMPFDEKLRRLRRLYSEGILTESEYEAEKRRILDQA